MRGIHLPACLHSYEIPATFLELSALGTPNHSLHVMGLVELLGVGFAKEGAWLLGPQGPWKTLTFVLKTKRRNSPSLLKGSIDDINRRMH